MGTREDRFNRWLDGAAQAAGISSQKELAGRIHDHKVTDCKLTTVIENLSRLRNGGEGGAAFFFGAEKRPGEAAAVASALNLDESVVREAWLRASVPTVILDPRLDEKVRAYFVQRGVELADRVEVRSLDPDAAATASDGRSVVSRLQEAARAAGDAVVVLAAGQPLDEAQLRGADVRFTGVASARRGWTIVGHPDLIPNPPPMDPPRFNEAGEPLWPLTAEEFASIERFMAKPGNAQERWTWAHNAGAVSVARGEVPALPLLELVAYRRSSWDLPEPRSARWPWTVRAVAEPTPSRDALERRPIPNRHPSAGYQQAAAFTEVFVSDGRVYAQGDQLELVRERLGPTHEVHEVRAAAAWRRLLERRSNPWAFLRELEGGSPDVQLVRAYFAKEERESAGFVTQLVERDAQRDRQDLGRALAAGATDATFRWREAAGTAGEELQSLLQREWLSRPAELGLATLLDLASRRRLVALPLFGRLTYRVLCDFGSGALRELRLLRLPAEPQPFRAVTKSIDLLSIKERDHNGINRWMTEPETVVETELLRIEFFEGGDVLLLVGEIPTRLPGRRDEATPPRDDDDWDDDD